MIEMPHLILHIDCNKTIIADDMTQGKTVEDVVNGLLAEKTVFRWTDQTDEELSYYRYVHNYVVPGEKSDPEVKARRRETVKHFVETMLAGRHTFPKDIDAARIEELKGRVKAGYDDLVAKLNGVFIFPSFYKLLNHLRAQKIPHCIALRTFGEDLKKIIPKIEKQAGVTFVEVEKPCAWWKKGELMKEELKDNPYTAFRDSYRDWANHKEHYSHGKWFPFNPHSHETLSIFFDDNIEIDPQSWRNIIAPYDQTTGKPFPVYYALKGRNAYQVDTMQAIKDENYFVDLVNKSLKSHGYTARIREAANA